MDGSFEGIAYFRCPPNHGIMIPAKANIVTFEPEDTGDEFVLVDSEAAPLPSRQETSAPEAPEEDLVPPSQQAQPSGNDSSTDFASADSVLTSADEANFGHAITQASPCSAADDEARHLDATSNA
jgi:hypothetical protein